MHPIFVSVIRKEKLATILSWDKPSRDSQNIIIILSNSVILLLIKTQKTFLKIHLILIQTNVKYKLERIQYFRITLSRHYKTAVRVKCMYFAHERSYAL